MTYALLERRRRGTRAGAPVDPSAMAAPETPPLRWPAALARAGERLTGGLSVRLLALTAVFVLAAQLLILAPSLATFEESWLVDRVRLAEVASLAVEAAPAGVVAEAQRAQLLRGAGVVSVAVRNRGALRLLLAAPRTAKFPELVDLRDQGWFAWLAAPFRTLGPDASAYLRVVAKPRYRPGDYVVIVVPHAPLQAEVKAYGLRLLWASVVTSAVAGLIVYAALAAFLVRPIRRITVAMERFRARPEDPTARLPLSHRRDEIGRAEEELTRMQADLLVALKSRARLAALGEAVAKINHDLKNMLTSAQIASERLAGSGDPRVAQTLPRLERALDRAVKLAQDVLDYGRSEEAPPARARLPLQAAVEAAAEDAGLPSPAVGFVAEGAEGLEAYADPDQLHRVLVNLFRNARQAIETQPGRRERGLVRLDAAAGPERLALAVADNGPGVPERVRQRLFLPFSGSAKAGGAGLGLSIARELVRAHGGDLTLAETGPGDTRFEFWLPEPGPAASARPAV